MSGRFDVFPDMEAVASVALRAAHIDGVQGVHSSIPAKSPKYPMLIVQRLGGSPAVRERLDQARIQIDVWGGSRKDAPQAVPKSTIHDIAQQARVVLLELEGTTTYDPVVVWISAVEDALGITWSPDPTSGRDRYLFSMWLYGRSVDETS